MREYVHKHVVEERDKYDTFRKTTGLNYKSLYTKHLQAVREVDSAREQHHGLANQGYMVISPVLFAYLTDIALDHLAMGAELYGELRENQDL